MYFFIYLLAFHHNIDWAEGLDDDTRRKQENAVLHERSGIRH